jgi:hypothetical protein
MTLATGYNLKLFLPTNLTLPLLYGLAPRLSFNNQTSLNCPVKDNTLARTNALAYFEKS